MLETIIDSPQKSAVISLLAVMPQRSVTVAELAKRLGLPAATIKTVLLAFLQHNIVQTFTKGRIEYFIVNPRHQLLAQVKDSLARQKIKYQDELFVALGKLGEVQAVFLSGIFTGQEQLPVDILLVGKPNLTKLDAFLQGCRAMMGQDINYSIMSPEEFSLRRNTFDRFIRDIFDYRHIVVFDTITKAT
jgi:hypothetical protein